MEETQPAIVFIPNPTPDWHIFGTGAELEAQFGVEAFKFKGPGIYHDGNGAIVIVPTERPRTTTWHQHYSLGEHFLALRYDHWLFGATFNALVNAPTRFGTCTGDGRTCPINHDHP